MGSCLPCGEADAELRKEGARAGPRAVTPALLPPAAAKEREDRKLPPSMLAGLWCIAAVAVSVPGSPPFRGAVPLLLNRLPLGRRADPDPEAGRAAMLADLTRMEGSGAFVELVMLVLERSFSWPMAGLAATPPCCLR